MNIFINY